MFGVGAEIQRDLSQPGSCETSHCPANHIHTGPPCGQRLACEYSVLPSTGNLVGKLIIKGPRNNNPEKKPVSLSWFSVEDFSSTAFCLKLGRELMQGSISVKLFGEQERDQNKRNNKRPLPARPFLYGTQSVGHKGPEVCPQCCRRLRSSSAACLGFEGPCLPFK